MPMNSTPITLESLPARVAMLEKKSEENHDAHDTIYNRIEKLESESGRVDEKYKMIIRDLDELKTQQKEILLRIETMAQQPAKRWDTAITSIITSVVGGIVGYFLSNIAGGMK